MVRFMPKMRDVMAVTRWPLLSDSRFGTRQDGGHNAARARRP